MIKFFCVTFLLFILPGLGRISFAQIQPWVKLQSPVNLTLRKLSFVDSLTGWATGEAGTIIRTTDGGTSWEIQNSTVQTFITDIFFLDRNFGWATTIEDVFPFKSIILKTTNGGENWYTAYFPDSTEFIRTIYFLDTLNGFVGGSNISFTTDGGNNWLESEVDSNFVSNYPVYNFDFYNNQFGYACGGRIDRAGVIWRTTNYGLNWTAQGVSADEVFDLFIFDSLNALTLSGDPEGLFLMADIKTTDAGITWGNDSLSVFGLSFAIDFRTYYEGWSASGYKFLLTTNRGEIWNEFGTPDSSVVYDLQFTDPRNGYAVGDDGVILKLDPTLVGVEDKSFQPDKIILYQNYPNPFNPSTRIGFHIVWAGFVSLKIYDLLGNEVAILVNEEKFPGKYEVEFNIAQINKLNNGVFSGNGYGSGVYFYQLRVGEFVQTKKMVYLK
jgi:photosystem II stability/assembly factor-like uncharacterized protein